jgi:hypothetical protein
VFRVDAVGVGGWDAAEFDVHASLHAQPSQRISFAYLNW